MNIGVIGAGTCSHEVTKIAEDVGARIAKMINSKFAEKYFGQRYWYLMEKSI